MSTEKREILIVDLDGTLLRSDMLYESFLSAFGRSWKSPFLSAIALSSGRASLKRYLASASAVEVETLPFDETVITFIKTWRSSGGRTALATASNQSFADKIAKHLGIFDEVYGSDGQRNLKGEEKGQFLEAQFGFKCFAYMGDTKADLKVWKRAAKAITVNAPNTLRRDAEEVCNSVEHLGNPKHSVRPYIKALRPHQWLKNFLVMLPMLAAHQLTGLTFLMSFLAFICFSLVASSVYVINDLLDLTVDRAHLRKKNRPFASGSVPIAHGAFLAVFLISLGAILAKIISGSFLILMVGYFLLTTAYSLHLKRRIVMDIMVLAGLYTARIVAGAFATDIPLSVWHLAFSIFFFLSLASVKRQAELIDIAKSGELKTRGRGYHVDDLPIIAMAALGAGYVSILVLMLYVNSTGVVKLYAHPEALWGVCCILLYWITRIVMVAHRGHIHDDPLVYAIKDPISHICLVFILGFVLFGVMA